MSNGLPTLSAISSGGASDETHLSPLGRTLSTLFEPSPILISKLEPQLASHITNARPPSYSSLIDVALVAISAWDKASQTEFIAGHPRIGESKNLSSLSAKEQGATGITLTPPEVLIRLQHLNACYEARFPGLRYITFVNGRSRQAIAEEMEDLMGFEHSLSPDDPPSNSVVSVETSSELWNSELRRAVGDVGRIAKSRLKALGAE